MIKKLSILIFIFAIYSACILPVFSDQSEAEQIKNLEEKIDSIETKISELDNMIKEKQDEIDDLTKERTQLKKIYKKNPSQINEAKLNKVLSNLRDKIEEKNKLELDKEIKQKDLKEASRELIQILNKKIEGYMDQIKELQKQENPTGIEDLIEKILILQEQKDKLYKNLDESYPEISKIPFKVKDDDPPDILEEKLNFTNDQLLLLDIKERKLIDNRDRLLVEYQVLQILIDFYTDASPKKDEMFDQMEILAMQVGEHNQLLKENKELIIEYKNIKQKIEGLLSESGGSK